jgi:hypothetical protein
MQLLIRMFFFGAMYAMMQQLFAQQQQLNFQQQQILDVLRGLQMQPALRPLVEEEKKEERPQGCLLFIVPFSFFWARLLLLKCTSLA